METITKQEKRKIWEQNNPEKMKIYKEKAKQRYLNGETNYKPGHYQKYKNSILAWKLLNKDKISSYSKDYQKKRTVNINLYKEYIKTLV